MPLTLNQIVKRIETIALAHKQVRTFKRGLVSDLDTDHTMRYPVVHLFDSGGQISITNKVTTVNFQMLIYDLVHVSEDTKDNEADVLSDMLGIGNDMVAQMQNNLYTDWRFTADANYTFAVEQTGDMAAGVRLDFIINVPFTGEICAVPSDLEIITPTDTTDMKPVYDTEYIATGLEGTTLSIDEILGQKVLLVTRENNPLHKVSNLPDPAEYAWDNTTMTLGTPTNPGERFLILYRKY